MELPPFEAFPKIPRYSRPIIVSEKLDGTNAQIFIAEDGTIAAGSRNRWITPEADNFGFASWVQEHAEELRQLGPGRHFGEWYGAGIQRRYGLTTKRLALFYSRRVQPGMKSGSDVPACCEVVPLLYSGEMKDPEVLLHDLIETGSHAVPGWMQPEGLIVFHTASGQLFKKLVENDNRPKGAKHESP